MKMGAMATRFAELEDGARHCIVLGMEKENCSQMVSDFAHLICDKIIMRTLHLTSQQAVGTFRRQLRRAEGSFLVRYKKAQQFSVL